ncbi:MAG: hypothetical protein IJD04_04120 [Desulfovibrionaceae bacterium]|nr:hypothetical protein [Desulfovibrionaceae bacterium]
MELLVKTLHILQFQKSDNEDGWMCTSIPLEGELDVYNLSAVLFFPAVSRPWTGPELTTRRYPTAQMLLNFVLTLGKNDAVLNLLPRSYRTLSLFRAINKSSLQSIELRNNAVATGGAVGKFWARIRRFTPERLICFVLRKPGVWRRLVGAPGRIIYGGALLQPGPGEASRLISAHAWDYDQWLKLLQDRAAHDAATGQAPASSGVNEGPSSADRQPNMRSYILFLDQNLPFHPDFKELGRRQPASAAKYFPALRRFFDILEQSTGLPVVVAAHPRADYARVGYSGPDWFGGRCIVSGETLPLLAGSSLVLCHTSTALNFAVIARKPVLHLTSGELELSEGHIIRSMAGQLNTRVMNIDEPDAVSGIPLSSLMNVDEAACSRYFNNYIKEAGSPEKPFWQILLDDLQACRL